MAVKIDNHGKTGRIQAEGKAAGTKHISNKQPEKPKIFEALLSGLKPKEKSQPAASLRNRPATANIIRSDQARATKNPKSSQSLNTQNVNNMAASALIAMTAISSGSNRMNGYFRGAGAGAQAGNPGMALQAVAEPKSLSGGQEIGALSAHFESGEKGPEVIGFDYKGGTSYGTYQIASRPGTMGDFLEYLSERAPDIARKLNSAGPANTGSRHGRMPEVWKKVAAEDTARFSKLQYDFIEKTHYLPAVQEISEKTGLDVSKAPRALQEVLWSTAVQHGARGAVKIFNRAVSRAQTREGGVQAAKLISSVYEQRAGQFGSSDGDVRAAVRNRFRAEGKIALAMLKDPFMKHDGVRA
ncbi:MAG: hypothetical protein AB9866_05880 [Syntrophobacteraceae bacterium]